MLKFMLNSYLDCELIILGIDATVQNKLDSKIKNIKNDFPLKANNLTLWWHIIDKLTHKGVS